MAAMTESTLNVIFAKAAEAANWEYVGPGYRVEVECKGCEWTVQLPEDGGPAYLAGCSGPGGHEELYIEATASEAIGIAEAVAAATGIHWPPGPTS